MHFAKYEALGNDYLVVSVEQAADGLAPALIRRLCDRHFGVGADGVLLAARSASPFSLRIFNPDGSEAEKSGNGLRIFARYLWDGGWVGVEPFAVATAGGLVECQVEGEGSRISVDMGAVSFRSTAIPILGPDREVLREALLLEAGPIEISAASLGNPHCVVLREEVSPALARRLGPEIERHPFFPRRTNVQFVQVLTRGSIRIEIWERGAGYTLASGSSSCAAAAVCHRLGLCDRDVSVQMPGGSLAITVRPSGRLVMRGPARFVAEGELAPAFLAACT